MRPIRIEELEYDKSGADSEICINGAHKIGNLTRTFIMFYTFFHVK